MALNIKEQLRILAQTQALDAKIYGLQKEKEEIPVKISGFQSAFELKKAALNKLEEESKVQAAKKKSRELDLQTKEEEISKLSSQLYSLKTNKEYQAMLTQISSAKSDNSLIEEDILKLMDEQEALRRQIEQEKASLAVEESKFKEEQKKMQSKINEINASLQDLLARRNQVIAGVDKKILSQYERVLKAKDGIALVKVEDNACQGCFMNVTHQVINEIKMFERIINCPACARMLYIEEDI